MFSIVVIFMYIHVHVNLLVSLIILCHLREEEKKHD